jgi:hypothetical protein
MQFVEWDGRRWYLARDGYWKNRDGKLLHRESTWRLAATYRRAFTFITSMAIPATMPSTISARLVPASTCGNIGQGDSWPGTGTGYRGTCGARGSDTGVIVSRLRGRARIAAGFFSRLACALGFAIKTAGPPSTGTSGVRAVAKLADRGPVFNLEVGECPEFFANGVLVHNCAFWRDETSATPDVEVYTALLPSLATTNGMLVGISTPYRKLGLLHQKYRDHYGVDGDDVLVVQGPTATFNVTLAEEVIEAQRQADPAAALSEWDADFRSDISAFLDDELIDRAVEHDRPLELPRVAGVTYQAFADASGGVGGDSYTVCVGHKRGEHAVVDALRGTVGKFDPEGVTREYAALLKQVYGVHQVVGDAYAAEWVASTWQKFGVSYVRAERPRSELYLECIPLFARGLVRLPNHAKLLRELRLLERHTHRSGRDSVDHPRGGHDDHANSVCGVLSLLASNACGFTLENMRAVNEKLALMLPTKYSQRAVGRHFQHRHAASTRRSSERRAAQLRWRGY